MHVQFEARKDVSKRQVVCPSTISSIGGSTPAKATRSIVSPTPDVGGAKLGLVIYLIGGAPRTGKTTTARTVAERTSCSWCSTDYLASAIFPYGFGPGERPRPDRLVPDGGNDERYEAHSVEEIVANYRQRASYYQLGILQGFVEYAATEGRDFVVEGFHLEPRSMVDTVARHPAVVRCLLLTRKDEAEIAASLPASGPEDWAVRFTRRPETFLRIAKMVVRYSEVLAAEADEVGCPMVEMSGGELGDRVRRAVDALVF
jgi:2-phosphoglycerate kinase